MIVDDTHAVVAIRSSYPCTKDTGIEWLGEIPTHWSVRRLKYVGAVTMGQSPSSDDYSDFPNGSPFLQGNAEFGPVYPTPRYYCATASKSCREGDLLLSVRAPVGALNIADQTYGIGRGLCAISPNAFLWYRDFAFYTMLVSRTRLDMIATGSTYDAVSATEVTELAVVVPPLDEQRAIAAFLDRETAKIDALIEKKERLIALLQEKRTALISHAVTKGLDPTAPTRDSGLPWIGQIPAHWDIRQLKWAIMFQRGHDLPTDSREDGSIPLVSSSGVSAMQSRSAATGPGIVTGRYGTIGQFYLIEEDYWPLNTTLYSISLRGNNPSFLYYLLTHLSPLFILNSAKSAVPGVDRNDIHPIQIALAPLDEQQRISDYLDQQVLKFDELTRAIRSHVELLVELRTALISAAVTGKIDVRGEVGA